MIKKWVQEFNQPIGVLKYFLRSGWRGWGEKWNYKFLKNNRG